MPPFRPSDTTLISASANSATVVAPVARATRGHGRLMLAALAASILVLSILLHAAGLAIDPLGKGVLPYYVAGALAVGLRLTAPRWTPRYGRAIGECAEYYAYFTLVALIGAVASYPIAALTSGFADDALQHADEALGFDWLAWYRLVAAHPVLQWAGVTVYRSIFLTPAILLGWFAWYGQRGAAHRFLATFWLAALLTLTLYAAMPAVGPLSHLWHGPLPYLPESEQWQAGLIPELRAHAVRFIDLSHLRGIVSAPSFHTAGAVIYIATAWRIREVRWPILALNAAMLLSTPVEGTHYLSDMILGAIVAIAAILIVRRLLPEPAR